MKILTTSVPSAPTKAASFSEGLFDSLPIVIGYMPVAFAFGMNAVKLGFTPLESIFLSCVIYAGASQFVITALLSAGVSIWVAALTVMAMDVRHVLYGPALRHRIAQKLSARKTALWAFGLTDEVFAAAATRLAKNNRRWSENWMMGVSLSAWLSWALGTVIGAAFGDGPLKNYPAVEAALSFMLPALFLSFLLASFKRRQGLVVTCALGGALLGLLLSSIPAAILIGIISGCLASLVNTATPRVNS
ncbi:AzlC family ABC transporter permease [Pectobacterium cacticida]|uniref:AzlC family ABC transporter permease n=1 Tax=Pectobacterium cacticida TaxID=69221 RepID=A0ABZ2GDZ4_9GAMM|nr:AzlC family ABC transporter permease [Pectobacterium cacticida]UYX08551.1 AzlC family ABC transporter permease [Pectobacterium cacticida]